MAKAVKIDFTGVDKEIKKSAKAARVPEGDYLVKIVKAELGKSEKSGKKNFSWRFTIVKPEKYKGKTLYDRTFLNPESLWNLRNLIHAALGKNVAGKALNFDPSKLYGKLVCVTVEDNEYDNKIRSQIADYQPKTEYKASKEVEADDDEDEDDDEVEEEVEEEDEDEEDEDLEDVDVDEL